MAHRQKKSLQTLSREEAAGLMQRLKALYDRHYKINLCGNSFVGCFHTKGTTDSKKAFILLVGKETWYRGCHAWLLQMRVEVRNDVLQTLEDRKPWLTQNRFSDFEALYEDVRSYLERNYIHQLIIYDVAVRLALLSGRQDLLPDKRVYLHAKPLYAYNKLVEGGLLPGFIASPVPLQLERKLFAPYLGTMSSIDIENLFCQIGKSCARIEKGVLANKQGDQEIDKTLKPYIL